MDAGARELAHGCATERKGSRKTSSERKVLNSNLGYRKDTKMIQKGLQK